jgi:hypothetical protein
MQSAAQPASAPVSNKTLWTGRIITALAVVFMLFDSVIHLLKIAPVVKAFAQLGYPLSLALGIGIVELISVVAYAVPRTSILGAILLTGYLGGAIATQVRIGAPLFSTVLFPVYVGMLIWGGLFLREERLRALVPLLR